MIQSENAPTLCPGCVHFTKSISVGCKIGDYGIQGPVAEGIRCWLKAQEYESSWTYIGPCPAFQYNGSSLHLMCPSDQLALRRLLGDKLDGRGTDDT